MSKKTKVWMFIAGCLVAAGLLLFAAVMTANDWDFTKLSTEELETNTHIPTESFSKIHIYTEEADVLFLPSEDNTCEVVCYESKNSLHTVDVINDALYIRVRNEKKWYDYIGIHLSSPKITVSLPRGAYDAVFIHSSTGSVEIPRDFEFSVVDIAVSTGDVTNYASTSEHLKIKTDTGDIHVENASANAIQLSVSTGHIVLNDIRCSKLDAKGSTGDIRLKNVIATQQFSIDTSTGDVKFDKSDAPTIFVKTDTGDVTGSLLSGKVFTTKTSTGSVKVPPSSTGGECNIVTSTGNIRLEVRSS